MITGLIAVFLIFVCVIPAADNGECGTMWLCIGIAALVLFFGYVSRMDDRARVNRMQYWSMSGKDRAKERHRWEAEAREDERRAAERRAAHTRTRIVAEDMTPREPTKAELAEAARRRAAYVAERRAMRTGIPRSSAGLPLRVCPRCRWAVRAAGTRIVTDEGIMIEYTCPVCRVVNRTRVGA